MALAFFPPRCRFLGARILKMPPLNQEDPEHTRDGVLHPVDHFLNADARLNDQGGRLHLHVAVGTKERGNLLRIESRIVHDLSELHHVDLEGRSLQLRSFARPG